MMIIIIIMILKTAPTPGAERPAARARGPRSPIRKRIVSGETASR